MSTVFNGATSYVEVADVDRLVGLGALFYTGQALAVLWKPNSSGSLGAFGLYRDHNNIASCNPYSDGKLYIASANFVFTDSGVGSKTYTMADGWRLDVFTTSNTAGSNQWRMHGYDYDTSTWFHVDLGTTGNGTTAGAAAPVTLGAFNEAGSGQTLDGKIAAVAVWLMGADLLTDADVETMAFSLQSWVDLGPDAVWSLEDLTSKPADVLGYGIEVTTNHLTTHSTDEAAGWSYALDPTPTGLYKAWDNVKLSGGDNTLTLTSDTFTPAAGDVLVAKVTTWDTGNHVTVAGDLTFTKRSESAPGGFAGYAAVWTYVADGTEGAVNVTATPDSSARHTLVLECWRNAQLAVTPAEGHGASTNGAPSVNITTVADDSVVTWVSFDSQSKDTNGRAYRLSATENAIYDGHYGTNTVAYSAHAQVGAAGTYAMGMTAPTAQGYVLAGVEIQANPTSETVDLAGAANLGGLTATATMTRRVQMTGAADLGTLGAAVSAGRRVQMLGNANLGALTAVASSGRTVSMTGNANLGALTATARLAGASSTPPGNLKAGSRPNRLTARGGYGA